MTDFVIPDDAVEAAIDVVMDDGHDGIQCAPDRNLAVTVRAALEAALPHLRAHQAPTCRGCSIDPSPDPGIPDQFLPDGDCPVHGEGARLDSHRGWQAHIARETRPVVDREALNRWIREEIDRAIAFHAASKGSGHQAGDQCDGWTALTEAMQLMHDDHWELLEPLALLPTEEPS